jgi:hypothetical protein
MRMGRSWGSSLPSQLEAEQERAVAGEVPPRPARQGFASPGLAERRLAPEAGDDAMRVAAARPAHCGSRTGRTRRRSRACAPPPRTASSWSACPTFDSLAVLVLDSPTVFAEDEQDGERGEADGPGSGQADGDFQRPKIWGRGEETDVELRDPRVGKENRETAGANCVLG